MGSAGHSGCVTRRGVRRDSRSVGRSDLYTGAGFFMVVVAEEELQARLVEKRLSNLEEECIG
jgi:hypothetical protein